mgnify:CR=1 FL=1
MVRPMRISALNRKLLRDLWHMKGQAVAIAMVVAAGVAMFVMYLSNFASLRETQRTYYQQQRFADPEGLVTPMLVEGGDREPQGVGLLALGQVLFATQNLFERYDPQAPAERYGVSGVGLTISRELAVGLPELRHLALPLDPAASPAIAPASAPVIRASRCLRTA